MEKDLNRHTHCQARLSLVEASPKTTSTRGNVKRSGGRECLEMFRSVHSPVTRVACIATLGAAKAPS